ncbi:hypothetical protein D3C76_1814540 [compost metagenome]
MGPGDLHPHRFSFDRPRGLQGRDRDQLRRRVPRIRRRGDLMARVVNPSGAAGHWARLGHGR